jgi:gamma-D-glutamyl-L-lysine dipeptidyl-peptidase
MTPARKRAVADDGTEELIASIRGEYAPDPRWTVFDIELDRSDGRTLVRGQAMNAAAVSALLERLRELGIDVVDEVRRLPDPELGTERQALVSAALAPVYARPILPSPQISQLVLGMRVELLSRDGPWVRLRAEDGYVGWTHAGYLQRGSDDWAFAWERGTAGEPVVSLGADLVDEDGQTIARLPWGARLVRHSGACQLPSGARGTVVNGEVVDVDRLADRFPPRGESIVRTARRWLATPYIWGGITPHGVDCSGYSQAVMWMHGIALPRDSDLQAVASVGVPIDTEPAALRAGDLLFFAEPDERISHVAISVGGSSIIHSALGNGGVHFNDLDGELAFEQRLRRLFVSARRVLPD